MAYAWYVFQSGVSQLVSYNRVYTSNTLSWGKFQLSHKAVTRVRRRRNIRGVSHVTCCVLLVRRNGH